MFKDNGKLLDFWRKRDAKIETALLNKKWTRAYLAIRSGHDVRTIRTVLAGVEPVRDQTIVDICQALEIEAELSEPVVAEAEVAAHWYGSYAREPYKFCEGVYYAYRRSFTHPDTFMRSIYQIFWDAAEKNFGFQEHQSYTEGKKQKSDHSQTGKVYISQFTDLIHLVTVDAGAVRLITLRKMRNSIMRGCVLTQTPRETFFQPSFSAIYLEKILGFDPADLDQLVGPIRPDHEEYATIFEEMEIVEKNVTFIAASVPPPAS